jgi:hypothetical protein
MQMVPYVFGSLNLTKAMITQFCRNRTVVIFVTLIYNEFREIEWSKARSELKKLTVPTASAEATTPVQSLVRTLNCSTNRNAFCPQKSCFSERSELVLSSVN